MNFSRRADALASKPLLALIAVLLGLALAGYWYWGGQAEPPTAASTKPADAASAAAVQGPAKPLKALTDEQLERMVAQATAQTQKEPANLSGWAMLAHSYEMLGKFAEASKAYAQLAKLAPNDAQVLADYADVLAVANGRSFNGEPLALVKRALAIDAKNVKALVLAGSAAQEQQDSAQALSYWERARTASTDPAFTQQIEERIAQAKGAAGTPALAASDATTGKMGATAGSAAAQVSGRVWLADDLRAKAPAQATLFVYARPVEGSRMPVALLKKKVSELPLNFTLDDSMAMVTDTGLSKQSSVVVVARISARGEVKRSPGDLEGVSAPVAVGTRDIKLEISEVVK